MKRACVAGILGLAAILMASNAFALSLSVDVPVQFNFTSKYLDSQKGSKPKDSASNDVSGFILGASAGWLGLGYERYDVDMKAKTVALANPVTIDFTLSYQFYDIFLDLPFPVIHPVIGYGKGTVNVNVATIAGTPTTVEPGDVSQVFARVGIPLGPLFDVHLGYHKITAQDAKVSGGGNPNSGDKFKASGDTYTLGVRLGW